MRFIEVPAELHRRYAHAEALALYQMIAKNVGIRRARGQFVLATNIDILFSDELAAFFAARRLEDGRMYRIDRHDAMSDVPAGAPIEEQLAYCRGHLIRINRREGTFAVSPDGSPTLSPGDIAAPDAGLLFGKGWLPVERYVAQEPFRWAGQTSELLLRRPPANASALTLDLEPGPGTGGEPLDLEVIGQGHQTLARVSVDRRSRLRLPLSAPFPEVARVSRAWRRIAHEDATRACSTSVPSAWIGLAARAAALPACGPSAPTAALARCGTPRSTSSTAWLRADGW